MAARVEALEAKISEVAPFRLEFDALIFELASLNSNVIALIEAMVSTLKQSQDKLQRVSKLDAEETRRRTRALVIQHIFLPLLHLAIRKARNGLDITRE